jgi:hypothetical protein
MNGSSDPDPSSVTDPAGIPYRTFMVDPLGALAQSSVQFLATNIQSNLASLFFSICGSCSPGFETAWVYFTPDRAAPVNWELLVYFMPPGLSIVQQLPGLTRTLDLTANGNTAFVGTQVASEVYVTSSDPVFLAKLAFHELMHNRLLQGDAMHNSQDGLGAAFINASTPITPTNQLTMAAVLPNPSQQWVGGISILNSGKFDPLSPYYQG